MARFERRASASLIGAVAALAMVLVPANVPAQVLDSPKVKELYAAAK